MVVISLDDRQEMSVLLCILHVRVGSDASSSKTGLMCRRTQQACGVSPPGLSEIICTIIPFWSTDITLWRLQIAVRDL